MSFSVRSPLSVINGQQRSTSRAWSLVTAILHTGDTVPPPLSLYPRIFTSFVPPSLQPGGREVFASISLWLNTLPGFSTNLLEMCQNAPQAGALLPEGHFGTFLADLWKSRA